MIPLHRLEKLPRHQRLRKMNKIFTEAENRLCAASPATDAAVNWSNGPVFSADECMFFAGIAELLAGDPGFRPEALEAFADAALVFRRMTETALESAAGPLRRSLNTVRHILLAETGRSPADWDFIDAEGKPDPSRRRSFPGMLVYLEDIRSPFNVGAIFRAAESFGVERLFLSPLCADPRHPRAKRSAMGCVETLPWERRDLFAGPSCEASENAGPALADAIPVFALETGGTPLGEFAFPAQGLLIAGSEELGVSPQTLAAADASLGRVSIPCYGAKGSLNVSVAFGIVMQAWAAIRSRAFIHGEFNTPRLN
ncbi:MAG: TrmH family RNA methyltransferase [Treponema sp.]|jgi:TrmH family RNA methyltransferase|nr:TrmH family RNA methyltransferase [Treponema sp.]